MTAFVGAAIGAAPPAVAAAPGNDLIANAATVSSLPFSTTVDTSQATAEEDGYSNPAASVWYEFTPPTTGDYDISTAGSDYDTVIGLWASNPFLYPFSSGQVAMRQGLIGGETYYIQIGNLCCLYAEVGQVGPGGNLVLSITPSVPLVLTLTVDPTAYLGRADSSPVTVSGTIACNREGLAALNGELRQTQGGKVAVGEFSDQGSLSVPCSPTPSAWRRVVTARDRKFVAKRATLTVNGAACDAPFLLGCDFQSPVTDVVIVR